MRNEGKVSVTLLILAVLLSSGVCFFITKSMLCGKVSTAGVIDAGWDAKKQLDFAETLANKGLKKEALTAFDDYLKIAKISAIESAKLLYRMGNMYMELLDYEKALYYFYKAETADPEAGFKTQLDQKLIECLENLGLSGQAQYELSQRASLGQSEPVKEPTGVVLAKVGDEEITESQIEQEIKSIPDWARENFSRGEGKVEFVRQYATTLALYKKAKRMGLDQDEEVKRGVRDITKKLLVQKFLESQLKDKVAISASDMETYYEANKDKYKKPALANISMIKISDEKKAQDAVRKLTVGADFSKMASDLSEDEATKAKGGLVETGLEASSSIPGAGPSKDASEAIFSKKDNEIAGPIKINNAYYIFKINKIALEKQMSFDEVKDQVEYEYKNKKVQEQMQVLLKNILQEQQVEVYIDKILGKEAPLATSVKQEEVKPQVSQETIAPAVEENETTKPEEQK